MTVEIHPNPSATVWVVTRPGAEVDADGTPLDPALGAVALSADELRFLPHVNIYRCARVVGVRTLPDHATLDEAVGAIVAAMAMREAG